MDGKFEGLLQDCVEKKVRVQRHGPDNVEGILRHCGSDFVVIESVSGDLVLYPITSIEALGMLVDGPDAPNAEEDPHPDLETVNRCSCLADVLLSYEKSIVVIGRQGPGKLRGLLLEVCPDYLSLMTDIKEIVHIPLWQLRSLTVGGKKEKKESEKDGKASASGGWSGLFK